MEWFVSKPAASQRKRLSVDVTPPYHSLQAYKHVFTSPSSVEKEARATRSGNARLHGMFQVTPASIAYIATQVQFLISCVIVRISRALF